MIVTTTTPLRANALAVVPRLGAGAGLEAAAVDPHHHRQALGRRRRGRPDVQVQAVLARRAREVDVAEDVTLHALRPELDRLAYASHGVAGCGALQRISPTGGAAYGMPLNTRIFPSAVVCPRPCPRPFSLAAPSPRWLREARQSPRQRVVFSRRAIIPACSGVVNRVLSEGLRPSDSPTRALARRFAGALPPPREALRRDLAEALA